MAFPSVQLMPYANEVSLGIICPDMSRNMKIIFWFIAIIERRKLRKSWRNCQKSGLLENTTVIKPTCMIRYSYFSGNYGHDFFNHCASDKKPVQWYLLFRFNTIYICIHVYHWCIIEVLMLILFVTNLHLQLSVCVCGNQSASAVVSLCLQLSVCVCT